MALRPPSPNDSSPRCHDHTAHTEERWPEVGPQPVPGIAVGMAGTVQDGSGGCKQKSGTTGMPLGAEETRYQHDSWAPPVGNGGVGRPCPGASFRCTAAEFKRAPAHLKSMDPLKQ